MRSLLHLDRHHVHAGTTPVDVIYHRTYMPPRFLLNLAPNLSSHVRVFDLASADLDKLIRTVATRVAESPSLYALTTAAVVCLFACLHICVLAYLRACISACLHICVRACVRACVGGCMRGCMRGCVRGACASVRVRVFIWVCVRQQSESRARRFSVRTQFLRICVT